MQAPGVPEPVRHGFQMDTRSRIFTALQGWVHAASAQHTVLCSTMTGGLKFASTTIPKQARPLGHIPASHGPPFTALQKSSASDPSGSEHLCRHSPWLLRMKCKGSSSQGDDWHDDIAIKVLDTIKQGGHARHKTFIPEP